MNRLKLLTIIISIAIILSGIGGYALVRSLDHSNDPQTAAEQTVSTEPTAAPQEETAGTEAPQKPEEPSDYIFASDYQAEEGYPSPPETLRGILSAISADHPQPKGLIFCGDYTNVYKQWNYDLAPDDPIAEIRGILGEIFPQLPSERALFIQGNHDAYTDALTASGLHEFDDCLIYVLNTEADYPWKQGKTNGSLKKVRKTAETLHSFFDGLIASGEKRPVFIASHVPLHFTARTSSLYTTGDNLYASLIYDEISRAANDLDIVFFYGHNHSKGWDSYLGGGSVFRTVGDTILIPEFDETKVNTDKYTAETLNFTYLNAGYTGYIAETSSDTTLTATLCEVSADSLTLTRYSANGIHPLCENGAANPFVDDTVLIPSEYYSTRIESPQVIPRRHR